MGWIHLTAIVLLFTTIATSRRCCPDDELFTAKERHCVNSTNKMALNCTIGRYILNPNRGTGKDIFTITPDDVLVYGHTRMPPDSYCVTTMVHKDGAVTSEDVAFVCFPETTDEDDDDDSYSLAANARKTTRHIVMGTLMWISVAFMLAMLLVYTLLPEMRDLEGKCLMCAVFSLCAAFVLLATLQFQGSNLADTACVTFAFLLYFWMLAAFFWLNVVSFNLWKSVIYRHSTYPDRSLFVVYSVYGWGCPLTFLVAAVTTDHASPELDLLRPNFGTSNCWFHGDQELWTYFYGPVAALICCNVLLFVWTGWRLWKNCREQTAPKLQSMRYKCLLYTKLFVIMGIPWVFELLSHLFDKDNTSYFWYATDILNALQGPLIFLITVVCRKRVLRGLSQHRTLGFNWPKSWAAGVDAESHAILADDDVEMSPPCSGEKFLA